MQQPPGDGVVVRDQDLHGSLLPRETIDGRTGRHPAATTLPPWRVRGTRAPGGRWPLRVPSSPLRLDPSPARGRRSPAAAPPRRPAGPRSWPRSPGGYAPPGRARRIPIVDRPADLRHQLRAFAEEEPRQLLQQVRVPIDPSQGSGQIEVGMRGAVAVRRRHGSSAGHEALEDFEELLGPDRLGDVGVHARLEAALAVALHGVGGHGDDRDVARRSPPRAARMAAVASKPSISGICTSISTRSNGRSSRAASASWPLPATHDRVAPLLQQADGEPLVDRRCPRPAGAGACAGPSPVGAAAVARRSRSSAPRDAPSAGHDRVQQVRLRDRLGQVGGDAQLPAARRVLALVGRRQHHQGGADRRPGPAGSARPASKPSISGIMASSSTSAKRLARVAGLLQRGQRRAAPSSTTVGFMPQLVSISSRMRRLVALSSTTRTGRPCRSGGLRRRRPPHRARCDGRTAR